MQSDNSQLFQIGQSQQAKVRDLHLFNKNTEIIKEGQRHKVIFGQMQQQKRTLHQIVAPYLHRFAQTTANIATKAGTTTYEALKDGFLWIYNKMIDRVIPYAVEKLPKLVFVSKKQEGIVASGAFEVLVSQQDYGEISKQGEDKGKKRVFVPLGTQNDKHFEEFLRNDKYDIREYSFPIDVSQEFVGKQSFMIPSQSFQVIAEGIKQAHLQLQIQEPLGYKKKAFRLDKGFIFQFQGQNSIEYDMLDSIEKSKDVRVGFIVVPEQTLRKSISGSQNDPIAMLVNGKEKVVMEKQEVAKEVDMTRNVKVDISQRKPKPEYELALN